MGINVKKRKICVNLWNLCALIRTSIRVIRAECGEETHSASPSTHRYPFNLGYPWSANLFYSCENALVSRFNSGDLAGKCAASNRQQKIAIAENNCLSKPKAWKADQTTGGGVSPRYTGSQQNECWGHERLLSPLQGFLRVDSYTGG